MGAILFGGFNLSKAFGGLRSKMSHEQQHSQQQDFYPPATPHRQASGGFIDQYGGYTPYHGATPYGSFNQNMIQQATQSMPALPAAGDVGTGAEEKVTDKRRSPSKKKLFA